MLKRTSHVQTILNNTLAFSSVIQLGDSRFIYSKSNIYAVRREHEIFFGTEGDNVETTDPLYFEPIPLPPRNPVRSSFQQDYSRINVGTLDITGIAFSAVVEVGNTQQAYMESRVKHIRQLKTASGDENSEAE